MGKRERMSAEEAERRVAGLDGWELCDGKLRRELEFADFAEAFSFMTRMALVSEKLDHHPSWSNVYRQVIVNLDTHDVGGLSVLDFEWAEQANAILGR